MAKSQEAHSMQKNAVKKKKTALSGIAKAAAFLALFRLGARLYAWHRRKKAGKKEEENEGRSYKSYDAFLCGREIRIGEENFSGARVHAFMSGVTLDLTEALIEEDIFLSLKDTFGGIYVKVPTGVNVRCDGKYMFSGVFNAVPDYEGEKVHTIFIEAKLFFGGLHIGTEQKNDGIVGDYFTENALHNISKGEF